MVQEIDEVFGDSDRPVVIEDINKLEYLERVIKETMRLFPVTIAIARSPTEDITIGMYHTYKDLRHVP